MVKGKFPSGQRSEGWVRGKDSDAHTLGKWKVARLVGLLKPGRSSIGRQESGRPGKGQVDGPGKCGSTDVWVSASHDNAHQDCGKQMLENGSNDPCPILVRLLSMPCVTPFFVVG